jgi:hypothetical protein
VATRNLNLFINGKDRASGELKKVGRSVDSLGKTASRLGKALVAVFAVNRIRQFAVTSLDAFRKQEEAEQRLIQALQKRGIATAETIQISLDAAKALQEISVVGDETAINIQAVALSFGASQKDAIRFTRAAADLSAALNVDLDQASRQLVKTLGGFAGELAEMIPAIKELTKEQLQAGAVLDLVEGKFKGFAEGAANTFSGQMKQLGNEVGDVTELFGQAMVPGLNELGVTIKGLLPQIAEFAAAVGPGITDVAKVAASALDIITAGFNNLRKGIEATVITLEAFASGIGSGQSFDQIIGNVSEQLDILARQRERDLAAAIKNVQSLGDLIGLADTTRGAGPSSAAAKKSGARPRDTATLSQSRFLTGVGSAGNLGAIQSKTEANTKKTAVEGLRTNELLGTLIDLVGASGFSIPITQGVFRQTGGGR